MKLSRPSFALSAVTAAVLALPAFAPVAFAQTADAPAPAAAPAESAKGGELDTVTITGKALGKGEARANSVVDLETIKAQPPGLDPLKLLGRVPGLQVSSSDALTGSFSMRLSMRGLNKEQIGVSIDGIPNGSTLSNGGTMPNRLLDPANLSRVSVAQTAGEIGTPSNQALGGFIDFRTRDPSKKFQVESELSAGNYGYKRGFVRLDTGEIAPGLTAYGNVGSEAVRTWPGEQSGRNRRIHADFRALQKFDGGSLLRATVSYNDLASNDYDAVALHSIAKYKADFEANPNTDALTDRWSGDPNIDQNNRGTRGIDSREWFAHLEGVAKFTDSTSLTVKPYLHKQKGDGWFYVPYKATPIDGQVYSVVPDGINPATSKAYAPVAVVNECYANQYQRTSTGALVKTPTVSFPTGVTAATLSAAGCPAASAYAMNPQSTWGAREASSRRGGYDLDRKGTLAELKTQWDIHEIRVGGWYEHIDRVKTRNWYLATDPKGSMAYEESSLYSISQDRHYKSNSGMAYAQDKMSLFDDKAELDIGATYQRFSEDYRSPVEFNGTRSLSVSSKLLPKIAALWRFTNNLEAFVSGSKNFSAIPDAVFEGTAAVSSKNKLEPETSLNKDLGVRWQSGPFGAAVQVYDIDYRNRISIQNGNPDGDVFSRDATTSFRNQGGINSRGIEFTTRYETQMFEIYANYAFNRARYVEDTPGEFIKKDDPVLGAPHHTAFLEGIVRPVEGVRLAANVKYTGKAAGTYNVVNNFTGTAPVVVNGVTTNAIIAGGPDTYAREYMPAYTLVGVSASYKLPAGLLGLKSTEIAFNVDNLFNKRYLGGLGAELTTSSPLTSGRYFLGSPRTFFFTLRAAI